MKETSLKAENFTIYVKKATEFSPGFRFSVGCSWIVLKVCQSLKLDWVPAISKEFHDITNADVICWVEGFKLLSYIYVILHIINTVKPPIHWKLGRKYLQNYLTEFQAGLWGDFPENHMKVVKFEFSMTDPLFCDTPTPLYHTDDIMWHHWHDVAPPPKTSWTLILWLQCKELHDPKPFVNFWQPMSYYFLS